MSQAGGQMSHPLTWWQAVEWEWELFQQLAWEEAKGPAWKPGAKCRWRRVWLGALRAAWWLFLPNIQELSCILGPNRGINHKCCCCRRQRQPNCLSNWRGGNVNKEKQPTKSHQETRNGTGLRCQVKKGACCSKPERWSERRRTNTRAVLASTFLRH